MVHRIAPRTALAHHLHETAPRRSIPSTAPSSAIDRVDRVPGGKSFSIGPIQVRGLDASMVRSGELRFELPVHPGTVSLPTEHAPAIVRFPEDCVIAGELEIDRVDGVPRIVQGQLRFEDVETGEREALVIENPASALEPSTGFLAGFRDWISDLFADVRFEGVDLDDDGTVTIAGKVDKPFFMSDEPLDEKVDKSEFPIIPMEVDPFLHWLFAEILIPPGTQ